MVIRSRGKLKMSNEYKDWELDNKLEQYHFKCKHLTNIGFNEIKDEMFAFCKKQDCIKNLNYECIGECALQELD